MSLSEKELAYLKEQARGILSKARNMIMFKYPFIGSVSMRMDIIPIRDARCRTACTNGTNIYFDLDFLSRLNDGETIFCLSHEIWHVVLSHILRLNGRDKEVFNIACDCEVNHMLKCDELVPPSCAILPPKNLEGCSAEEIYEHLINNQEEIKKLLGSGGSPLSGQFDNHEYSEDTDDDQNEVASGVKDKWGDVGLDPDFNMGIDKNLADRISESVIAASQYVEKMKGDIPLHVKRIVEGYAKPEVRWEEALAQFVTTIFNGSNRTWIPPNRRYVWQGMYFPSSQDSIVDITVAIDTSGSTSDSLSKFFYELKSIVDTFGNYNLNVIQCDAEVSSCVTYNSNESPFDFSTKGFEFTGGGGTSFIPVFDYIKNNNINTECLVFFTDGYGDAPELPPGYPVLWIITENGTKDFCKWGRKIKFKNRKD